MFYNKKIFKRCFNYKKRYWYLNLKHIPLYFKLMHFLIKNGYDEYATWETFDWFIDTMREILLNYRTNSNGIPILLDNYPMGSHEYTEEEQKIIEKNNTLWYSTLDRMIELLNLMDERNLKNEDYDWKQTQEKKEEAKNEFFKLFSKYFYNLWD